MEASKKVSELTEKVTAHLVQENLERADGFPYRKAKKRFNWHSSERNPITDIKYDYEEKLYTLLKKNTLNHDLHENRPIVIVGGRGSGKTTAVVNVLKKLSAENISTFIRIDMNQWDDRPFEDEDERKLQLRFAAHLSEKIKSASPKEPTLEEELYEFFPWCIDNRSKIGDMIAHVEPLSNFLRRRSTHIRKLLAKEPYGSRSNEQLYDDLVEGLEETLDLMSEIDAIWYQLLQLICFSDWDAEKVDLSKRILILDNIDPVDPRLQRFAAKLFQSITLASGVQTIIPMRPHTQIVGNTAAGADWYTREDHCSPNLIDVINARLDKLIDSESDNESATVVKKIRQALNKDAKHLKEIVSDTSALDIRTGLINFSNFVERLLASRGIDVDFDLDQSEVCRLFFLGDRNRFNYHYAENLFCYASGDEQVITMCKVFTLDFILRHSNGSAAFSSIRDYLVGLGLSKIEIECSLGNLLSRSRALLWSPDGFDQSILKDDSPLHATPLAFTYYYRLFGEYYYTEVCMMDRRFHTVSVSEVFGFEKEFVRGEVRALLNFVDARGAETLRTIFPSPSDFLGLRHWRRFQHGARFRLRSDTDHLLDPLRSDWLQEIYGQILYGNAQSLDGVSNELGIF